MCGKTLWLMLALLPGVAPLAGHAESYIVNGRKVKVDSLNYLVYSRVPGNEALGEFCFYSLREALTQVRDGSEKLPMTIYLAPGVYFLDEDSPGMTVRCNWLRLTGVADNATQVVVSRSGLRDVGEPVNKPLLRVYGLGFGADNITFGTGGKIDGANIRGRLLSVNGDKGLFRDCRFLGLMSESPVNEGMRMLYDNCFFECVEFALNGFSVYLNCSFNLSEQEPLFNVPGTGVVFLNCDFRLQGANTKYLALDGGQIALVDCDFMGDRAVVEWARNSNGSLRCYQSGVTLNGKPYLLNSNDSAMTVEMDGMPLLNAYKYMYGGKTIYNVYNLLSGHDGWDPAEQRGVMTAAANFYGRELSGLPVSMSLLPNRAALRKGDNPVSLVAKPLLRGGAVSDLNFIGWTILTRRDGLVEFEVPVDHGNYVFTVLSALESGAREQVVVSAVSDYGLESSSVLDLIPLVEDAEVIPVTESEKRRGLFRLFNRRDRKKNG